jgi:hypothetical protein
MQSVIGDWHDSLKLTETAEELFGGVDDSGMVSALRNVTRDKCHQAFEVLTSTRAALSGKNPVSIAAPSGRKSPTRAARSHGVAA